MNWQNWTYSDWNERLFDHVLGVKPGQTGPVHRIPATPEELCLVAGASMDEVDAVRTTFVKALRAEREADGASFLRYCLNYRTDGKRDWWSPKSPDTPYFFGMLWLACLVAFGEFDAGQADHSFARRLGTALGQGSIALGRISVGSFDDVWDDLAKWTEWHNEEFDGVRRLVLPPDCPNRKNIGRPYYLAFPHRLDRERLAKVLTEAGCMGGDPPVRPVLQALRKYRSTFSKAFQHDLDDLFQTYLKQERDPKDSAFWRAVRHVATSDAPDGGLAGDGPTGRPRVLFEFDEDGWLAPFLALASPSERFPAERLEDLEFEVDGLKFRTDSSEEDVRHVLLGDASALQSREARAFRDGVVALLEEASELYRVAFGTDIASCNTALVRHDLADSVGETFGPAVSDEASALDGWRVLCGLRLEQRAELPAALKDATSLHLTTDSPPPTFIGGVRFGSSATFFAHPQYLPMVRAPGAENVTVTRAVADGSFECSRDREDPALWLLPQAVADCTDGSEWCVQAVYLVELLDFRFRRIGKSILKLDPWVLSLAYRGLASGDYHVETCDRRVRNFKGPADSVPLGVTTTDPGLALDTLMIDPSLRWLGPGVGEMSTNLGCGFPWLAIGPKNRPTLLVLLHDDPGTAPRPTASKSPDKGDCRTWKRAFARATPRVWLHDGQLFDRKDWPDEARQLWLDYEKATKRQGQKDEGTVPPTGLTTQVQDTTWGTRSGGDGKLDVLSDVVAQIASNKSGIPLREMHNHLAQALGLGGPGEGLYRKHLIRSMEESGKIDVLRRADGRQRIVVVRRPRLVAYRHAGAWKASLVGWLPRVFRDEIIGHAAAIAGLVLDFRHGKDRYIESMLVFRAETLSALEALSSQVGLPPLSFVDWPNVHKVPDFARFQGDLNHGRAYDAYEKELTWCWEQHRFLREPMDGGDLEIHRLRDQKRVPVFQLMKQGDPMWSYSRTWALLTAHEEAGVGFIRVDPRGLVHVEGASPLHLPLPIARLCALTGMGLPGPVRDGQGGRAPLSEYLYPFGAQMLALLRPCLPKGWFTNPAD